MMIPQHSKKAIFIPIPKLIMMRRMNSPITVTSSHHLVFIQRQQQQQQQQQQQRNYNSNYNSNSNSNNTSNENRLVVITSRKRRTTRIGSTTATTRAGQQSQPQQQHNTNNINNNTTKMMMKKTVLLAMNMNDTYLHRHRSNNSYHSFSFFSGTCKQQQRSFAASSARDKKKEDPSSTTTTTTTTRKKTNSTTDVPFLLQFHSLNLGLLDPFVFQRKKTTNNDQNNNNNNNNNNTASSSSLLLLDTIRQLPEIETILQIRDDDDAAADGAAAASSNSSSSNTAVVDIAAAFDRALEVFTTVYGQGSIEHQAILALSAEYQIRYSNTSKNSISTDHNSANMKKRCIETIQELQEYCQRRSNHNNEEEYGLLLPIVQLGLAKAYWLHGDFASSLSICDNMIQQQQQQQQQHEQYSMSTHISAQTGYALSKLLLVNNNVLDDVFSIRDYFRMVTKYIERHLQQLHPLVLPGGNKNYMKVQLASAYMNLGVSEIIYAETVANVHGLKLHVDVPLDQAMRTWKHALSILERSSFLKSRDNSTYNRNLVVSNMLQAKINTNLAWGLLQMSNSNVNTYYVKNIDGRDIEHASEFARKALSIYDYSKNKYTNKEGMRKTLTLIAECYAKTGSAITAEGLYQSVIGTTTKNSDRANPCEMIDLRDAYTSYGALCDNWENRESYGQQLKAKAVHEIEQVYIPKSWQNKSSIHSSLLWLT